MKFDYYLTKDNSPIGDSRVVEKNYFDANKTIRIKEYVNGKQIILYARMNIGLSYMLDDLYLRLYLGLGDNLFYILNQINCLFEYYNHDTIEEKLEAYPYISHILSQPSFLRGNSRIADQKFKEMHPFYFSNSALSYYRTFGRCKYKLDMDSKSICVIYEGSLDKETEFSNQLSYFVEYADNLINEIAHFKINLNNLPKKRTYLKSPNSGTSDAFDKALAIGGILLVRAAVKIAANALGTDTDVNIDFTDSNEDVPNFHFSLDETQNTDISFDNQTGYLTPDINNSYIDNPYVVPFGSAPNDGTYLKSSADVHITCAGGPDKGIFDVYLHNGEKYIDFQNHWIKINGKNGFYLNGNWYIIKPA